MFLIPSFHTYLFNPSEFWNHISKLLYYFVCSSLAVRDFFISSTLVDFTATFYQRLLSLLIFKTKGEFSLQVSEFAAEVWHIGIHSQLGIMIVKIYILVMCSFIFKYVPVMNHGHLLADKNSLAHYIFVDFWLQVLPGTKQLPEMPLVICLFPKSSLLKPELIRGQISQSCCVFRLETDYKQVNKLHNIYILSANTHQVDIISLNQYFKIFGHFYNGEMRCRVFKAEKAYMVLLPKKQTVLPLHDDAVYMGLQAVSGWKMSLVKILKILKAIQTNKKKGFVQMSGRFI